LTVRFSWQKLQEVTDTSYGQAKQLG